MFSVLLDLVFPRRSLSGSEGEFITAEERAEMRCSPAMLEGEALADLHATALDRIFAAARYASSPLFPKAVHTFKYGRIPGLHEDLGRMIADNAPAVDSEDFPVLCPVPLHWTRKFERGFNQSELLANVIGRELGFPVHSILRRVRRTGHQAWREREDRAAALKDAFSARGSDIPPFVILVDDLCTSGTTLNECAGVLKKAGVKRVEGWVVALG